MNLFSNQISKTTSQGCPTILPSIQTISNQLPVANSHSFNSNDAHLNVPNLQHAPNPSNSSSNQSLNDRICHTPVINGIPVDSQTEYQTNSNSSQQEQIKMKHQPDRFYCPESQEENEQAAHFIRCEKNDKEGHPSIYTYTRWTTESRENYIEVALVDINDQPHPYDIDCDKRNLPENQDFILKVEVPYAGNMLLFRLNDDDFLNGYKSFEIIPKKCGLSELARKLCQIQDDRMNELTQKQIQQAKAIVEERELNKAKVRFTRIYLDRNDGLFHEDKNTTVYSTEMIETQQITIKIQPRKCIHPRNRGENEQTAHFIPGEEEAYPSINIHSQWQKEFDENYIQVTPVNKNHQPHLYDIGFSTQGLPKNQNLIVPYGNNALLFRLTKDDFENGSKSFKITLNKCTLSELARKLCQTQNDPIKEPTSEQKRQAKNIVRERELYKSKLRFTRVYRDRNDGLLHEVKDTTVYSIEMIEKNCDISVDRINPKFGPMNGDQPLDVFFKGLTGKDKEKLSFTISCEANNWSHSILDFQLNKSIATFSMPALRSSGNDSIKAMVTVYYDDSPIFESPFLYVHGLDTVLQNFDMIRATSNVENSSNRKKGKRSSSSSSTVSKKRLRN